MRKVILMILLAVVSNSAVAEWAQEPSSFMGIALGKPISDSIPEVCPKYPNGETRYPEGRLDVLRTLQLGITCYDDSLQKSDGLVKGTTGSYKIMGLKVPPIHHNPFIKTLDSTLDGAVGMVVASFKSSDFSQVMKMLTIKFGSPHKEEIEKFKTNSGAEFDNTVLLWSGEKVLIKVESLATRGYAGGIYEYGAITVVTTEYLTKQSQESNDAAKKGAAGL